MRISKTPSFKLKNPVAAYYAFLFLLIYEWLFWFLGGIGGSNTNISTDFFVVFLYLSIFLAIFNIWRSKWRFEMPIFPYYIYKLLLFCNFIAFIRGFFNANDYFEWKTLLVQFNGGLALFSPLFMVIGLDFENCKRIFKLLFLSIGYALFLIPLQILQFFPSEESFARIMMPAGFLILFTPYLKKTTFIKILIIISASLILTFQWRTMVMRLTFSVLILAVYYFRKVINNNFSILILFLLFFLPIYYVVDGITTGKSVFAKQSQNNSDTFESATGEVQKVAADTRTALYVDVLVDLTYNNLFIEGKGGVARYKSIAISDGENRNGRYDVEVGALRILLMTGLIGLILNGLLTFMAAYKAIKYSNNFLSKMMGIFLASFWFLIFIENFYCYNINFAITWIFIGLCFSKKFRALSDNEIKILFKLSFENKKIR